jgi:hypothetical protein
MSEEAPDILKPGFYSVAPPTPSRLVLDGLAQLADHGAHGADAGFVQVDPALLGASTLTLG